MSRWLPRPCESAVCHRRSVIAHGVIAGTETPITPCPADAQGRPTETRFHAIWRYGSIKCHPKIQVYADSPFWYYQIPHNPPTLGKYSRFAAESLGHVIPATWYTTERRLEWSVSLRENRCDEKQSSYGSPQFESQDCLSNSTSRYHVS